MKFFMLMNKANGLYYRKNMDCGNCWVPQEDAAVWTSPQGPAAVKGTLTRRARNQRKKPDDVEIMEFVANRPQVTIVSGDDWEGLYINGELIEESHHIGVDDVLGYLGIPCDVIYPDQDWLVERGCLPVELSEVKE
jgi:hypothetical protein